MAKRYNIRSSPEPWSGFRREALDALHGHTSARCGIPLPSASAHVGAIWRAAVELTGDYETLPLARMIADKRRACKGRFNASTTSKGMPASLGGSEQRLARGKHGGSY